MIERRCARTTEQFLKDKTNIVSEEEARALSKIWKEEKRLFYWWRNKVSPDRHKNPNNEMIDFLIKFETILRSIRKSDLHNAQSLDGKTVLFFDKPTIEIRKIYLHPHPDRDQRFVKIPKIDRGRYPDYRKAFEESGYGNLWFDAPIYAVILQNPSYQVTDLGRWIHGANEGALALESWIKKK